MEPKLFMNMLHVTFTGGPLKLGLILASYPDVLPISLSRKSEGDIGALRDLALFVSFVATKLSNSAASQK